MTDPAKKNCGQHIGSFDIDDCCEQTRGNGYYD